MDRGSWHCTGDRNQDHPQEKGMQKSKLAVWGGLTNSCERKGREKQRRKGKISSVQFSPSVGSNSLWPHESQQLQASLSITNSRSLLKLMPIESVMPSSHLILCCPLLLLPPIPPSIRVFSMSQLFAWGGQSIGVSTSTSVLPMNTQDWSPSGWTGWISLQSKGLSRVFSNTTVQKHQFFGAQLSSHSNSHIHTWPLEKP